MDITVVVEKPDISDREYARLEISALRFLLVPVVLEGTVRNAATAIKIADLSGSEPLTVIVDREDIESRMEDFRKMLSF